MRMSASSATEIENIRISLHEKSLIQRTVICTGNGVRLGKHVLVAANCTFAPVNHEYKTKEKLITNKRFAPSKGGIIVEDNVWISVNVVVLDGAIIRKDSVIGAASLVKGELEEYGVYLGNTLFKIGERR